MAQPQFNISVTSPGFYGMNTQESPLDMEKNFARLAQNCVIDRFGRIASRRGFQYVTENPDILGGNPIVSMNEFVAANGDNWLFCTGNNTIFYQERTGSKNLVALTLPVGYTITDDNWQIVPFNDKCYFVQAAHEPLVFDPLVSTTDLALWQEDWTAIGTIPAGIGFPNCATASFGRLWLGDFDNDKSIVAWSALLNGESWATDSGFIETAAYWPNGYDAVTALAGHNNFFCIFGQRNILLYTGAEFGPADPQFFLQDTIEGLGCIARDSLVATGIDYFFVDPTGVRTLARTIQEKSVPLGDISMNVRDEFQFALRFEDADRIKGVFHVEDSFYVTFMPQNPKTYVFDTWNPLPTGAARATVWESVVPICGCRTEDRETYFGGEGGVYLYQNASDVTLPSNGAEPVEDSIYMLYQTHPMDFGSPADLLFPKQVDVTIIGGQTGQLALSWGFDYNAIDSVTSKDLAQGGDFSYWDDNFPPLGLGAEWNDPDNFPGAVGQLGYWSTGQTIRQLRYNIWGSGRNIALGFSINVLGSTISIQEFDIQALKGRIL